MKIDSKELLRAIRAEHPTEWISLKLACDYINKHYYVIDLNELETITDINRYQDIVSEECTTHKTDCPYVKLDDSFAGGCVCCLCDAINRRDDIKIDKK